MSSNRSLLITAMGYSFVNILNAAIPFFMLPILTRFLLPEEYGVIAMFNASLAFIGALTGLSVHGIINVRYVDRDEIDYPQFIGSVLFILLVSTMLVFMLLWFNSETLSQWIGVPVIWIRISVILAALNVIIQVRLGLWMMAGAVTRYGRFQILMALTNMLFSLLFVMWFKWNYDGRFLGQSVAYVVFALVAFFSIYQSDLVKFRPSKAYIKEALLFGVPLIPHLVGGILLGYADRFLINKFLGLESAGIYMVAAQFGLGMGLLTDAFNKAFVPWLFEHLKKGDAAGLKNVVKVTGWYFLTIAVMAALLMLVAYWILYIIAGPKYTEATLALQWVFFGLAFNGVYLMVTNYIFFCKKTRYLAWITLFSGFLGVIFTWFLVQRFGIAGASMAYTFTMMIRCLLTWIIAQKVYPMPWLSMFKRKTS